MAAAGYAGLPTTTTALHPLSLEPSENWDDDFEFQPDASGNGHASSSTGKKRRHTHAGGGGGGGGAGDIRKLSVASSMMTEDWDADPGADVDELGNMISLLSSALQPNLNPWTPEKGGVVGGGAGGSGIPGQAQARKTQEETENWDDDFEDARNSPDKGRRQPQHQRGAVSHPLLLGAESSSPRWDDEDDDDPNSPSRQYQQPPDQRLQRPIQPLQLQLHQHRQDDEDDFHDDEFGLFPDDEEDRTVTAKSRRAFRAAARQSLPPLPLSQSQSQSSNLHPSPPPVPALPPSLFPQSHAHPPLPRQNSAATTHTHTDRSRSPSSSVFSVPNTIATAHTYSSTAHLRPTSPSSPSFPSASSAAAFPSSSSRGATRNNNNPYAQAASGFALLPPSPPIHKDRERRRLRKKSRPRPGPREGMFELVSVGSGSGSLGAGRGSREGFNGMGMGSRERLGYAMGMGMGMSSKERLGIGSTESLGRIAYDLERRRFSVEEEREEGVDEEEEGQEFEDDAPAGPRGVYDASPLSDVSSMAQSQSVGVGGSGAGPAAYTHPHPHTVPATPTKASASGGGGGTGTGTGTSLLSRIGSVKKWGAGVRSRRRGGSVTPGDVIESQQNQNQNERTPRPQSSLSSFHPSSLSSYQPPLPPQPIPLSSSLSTPKSIIKPKRHSAGNPSSSGSPPANSGGGGGWFFRASGSGSGAGSPRRVSAADASARGGTGAPAAGAGLARGPSTRTTGSARSGSGRSRSRSRSRAGTRVRGGGNDDLAFFESGSGAGGGGGGAAGGFQLRGANLGGAGGGSGSGTATPSKLIKRKSLGFVKLGMGFGSAAGGGSENASAPQTPGKGRYEGIGLGRAVAVAGAGGNGGAGTGAGADDKEGSEQDVPQRSRRKSFSRFLRDRGGGGAGGAGAGAGETLRPPSSASGSIPIPLSTSALASSSPFVLVDATPGAPPSYSQAQPPTTPTPHSHLKEKEGSRSFIQSVRRLSLVSAAVGVGRHKRSKSGGTTLDGHILPPAPAPGQPSGGKENRRGGAGAGNGTVTGNGNGNLPYALPPLPASASASASQLSLRLPSNSTSNSRRMVSSSSQSQSQSQSRRSSVLPASSTSSSAAVSRTPSLSRAPSLSRTPSLARERRAERDRDRAVPGSGGATGSGGGSGSARRSRASEEGPRRSSIGVAAGSGGRPRASLDFDFGAQIAQAGARERERLEKEKEKEKNQDQKKEKEKEKTEGVHATTTTTAPATVSAGMLLPPIELHPPSPPETVTAPSVRRSRTSIDMQMFENPSNTLGSAFSMAPKTTTTSGGTLSPTTSTSSIFFTPNSSPNKNAGAASGSNKLTVGYSPGKSPSGQSASLGRATSPGGALVGNADAGGTGGSGDKGASGSGNGSAAPPRRNSLGDLKIPARISQAQVGLRRDLGMVREFANNIEQLKELMEKYSTLVSEVQTILDAHAQRHAQLAVEAASVSPPPQRATSPSFFANLSVKVKTRGRSNTNPSSTPPNLQPAASPPDVTTSQFAYKDMASAFYTINSRYRISWECAELLIELGGGGPTSADSAGHASAPSPPPTSSLVPMTRHLDHDPNATPNGKRGRERAITLAGDEGKPSVPISPSSTFGMASSPSSAASPPLASPPNNTSWRASTGRHDLSHRQLVLLREMLSNSNAAAVVDAEESHLSIPEDSISPARQSLQAVNRDWRWGDARNSTITLPSEESTGYRLGAGQDDGEARKVSTEKDKEKKRGGLLGMAGIRDMLRAMKKSHVETQAMAAVEQSAENQRAIPSAFHSTTSLSTQSSAGSRSRHRYPHPRVPSQLRKRGKSSTGPESVRSTTKGRSANHHDQDQYSPPPPFNHPVKPSPRRPSLASIFRIGNKNRPSSVAPDSAATDPGYDGDVPTPTSGGTATGEESSSNGEEEDWDRMDSASDLDAAARALGIDGAATVRGLSENKRRGGAVVKGRSPYLHHDTYQPPLPQPVPSSASSAGYSQAQSQSQSNLHTVIPKRSFTASQSSLWTSEQYQQYHQGSPLGTSHMPSRTTRLSNVEEHSDDPVAHPRVSSHPIAISPRPGSSRSHNAQSNFKTGSVRSMPPQIAASSTMLLPGASSDVSRLAMTPENIKPLLENAKDVHARLAECIDEIQSLLQRTTLAA